MSEKVQFIIICAVLAVFSFFVASTSFVIAQNQSTTYATVYILNSLPVVTNVVVSPSPANPSDTMTVTANVTDANGDLDAVWAKYYNTTGLVNTVYMVYNATSGLYQNTTFTLPADAVPGTWNVTVYANDTYGTSSNYATFNVNGMVALELINSPIDFGNASAGDADRRADNGTEGSGYSGGTIKGFPLQVNNTGNVNENYTISGLNLVGQTAPAYNIPVGNVKYNVTNSGGAGVSLSGSEATFASAKSPGAVQNLYFWLTVPAVPQQEYRGNVTIRAYQS